MKRFTNVLLLIISGLAILSCKDSDKEIGTNDVVLKFNNTFKNSSIILGSASSEVATENISAKGQVHHFSELKYVISNIRLLKADGSEYLYFVHDLDKGAFVIDQSKESSLSLLLADIPSGEYKQIRFGLGVTPSLNTLDQVRFPNFYATAGANDTKMMWEWGAGYRFTKIEGFYDTDNKKLSIHTGSTVEKSESDPNTNVLGVNAYREITLNLGSNAIVGQNSPKITIKADFDKLLSGKLATIELGGSNATPNIHTAVEMEKFVNNLGGDGRSDVTGMFSIQQVAN